MRKLKIVNFKELETILDPAGYHYVHVGDILPGECVRWYDQDAKVTSVNIREDGIYLKVIDPSDNKEKEFKYRKSEELLVKSPDAIQ